VISTNSPCYQTCNWYHISKDQVIRTNQKHPDGKNVIVMRDFIKGMFDMLKSKYQTQK